MSSFRLKSDHPYLAKINRNNRLDFEFNDQVLRGYQGDNLASALLANGIFYQARSFKYGRFRGIFGAGVEEPNAIIKVIADQSNQASSIIPNLKATEVILYQNLMAKSASANPSLYFDWRAFLKPLHPFMPAGFYYKTFIKPKFLQKFYETVLRNLAGFSETPTSIDPDHYTHYYQNYDLLVVGGGISGLAACYQAAENGFKVCLVDERNYFGGSFCQNGSDLKASKFLLDLITKVKNHPNINAMIRSSAIAYHDHNLVLVVENNLDHLSAKDKDLKQPRQILHKIRATKVLLATGAHERGLLFSNNDLPKIMLASSLQHYLHYYSLCLGKKVVITGNNNSIYQVALDLKMANPTIELNLVDSRDEIDTAYLDQLKDREIDYHLGFKAIKAEGKKQIKGMQFRSKTKELYLQADLLGMSGGFNPVCHLDCHTGKMPKFSQTHQAFLPDSYFNPSDKRAVCGSHTGLNHWQACYQDGINQVNNLFKLKQDQYKIEDISLSTADFEIPDTQQKQGKNAFVDYQNDVKVSDIQLAIRENYISVEHIKRYSALGFGTDQGKTSNVNGIAVAAKALNTNMNSVGTTTFRPSYTPIAFGALAGIETKDTFDPQRYTQIQCAHDKKGAIYELVGQWYRPHYFAKNQENLNQAVYRESLAARKALAMMDASTLGKIDIQGKDAREFICRIYTNDLAKLKPGHCRYVLMCDENGMLIDDGVISCIDDNHFMATTTTGGAQAVLNHMENWLQTEWSDLKVWLNSLTDHFATIALVGPKSRKFMQQVCKDIDFSQKSFAFMQFKQGAIDSIPVRIMRISFSGELAYEINVQSNYALYLWNLFLEKGKKYNLTLYGTETMHILRAEKGYVITHQDTDGSVSPYDANMHWAVAKTKEFSFIGERSLTRSDLLRENRKQLVGLYSLDKQSVVSEGAQLIESIDDTKMIGHISSSYFSPILGYPIALGLVKGGLKRMGQTIYAKSSNKPAIAVKIVSSVFYDPENKRINGADEK